MIGESLVAPDLSAAVTGWRTWSYGAGEHPLTAMNGVRWQPTMRAQCKVSGDHRAPAPHCSCGLYSFYERDRAERLGLGVIGVINCWGTVEAHRDGMRAEHARIVAVAAAKPGQLLINAAAGRTSAEQTEDGIMLAGIGAAMIAALTVPIMALVGIWSARAAWIIALGVTGLVFAYVGIIVAIYLARYAAQVVSLRRYCRRNSIHVTWTHRGLERYADSALSSDLRVVSEPTVRTFSPHAR